MKIIISFLWLNLLVLTGFAQDTAINSKNKLYFRLNPLSIASEPGKIQNRLSQSIEVGKTFGPLDIGISIGRLNTIKNDSSHFALFKLTFDAAQIGIFSNEFSIGAGTVFNSSTPLMFDISSTLFAQVGQKIAIGAVVGTSDFSGVNNQFSRNNYGILLRYGFLRSENGDIISRITSRKTFKPRRKFKH